MGLFYGAKMTVTTIYFDGVLGRRFGRRHLLHLDSQTPREAIRALRAILPGFEQFLLDADAKGIPFAIWRGAQKATENIGVRGLYEPAGGALRMATVPAGAKKAGLLQTIIGIVLIVVSFWTGGSTLAAGIAMTAGGVVQMLTPLPKLNKGADSSDNQSSYVFNGPVNTSAQGGCVPVAYGRVRVGSAIISGATEAQDYSSAASNIGTGTVNGSRKMTPYDSD